MSNGTLAEWVSGYRLVVCPYDPFGDTGPEPVPAKPDLDGARRWDQIWAETRPWLIVVSTVAVELAWLVQADPVVRGPLVLWFSLGCTGMAWVRLLRIGEPLAEAVAAIALSVALSG